MDWNTPGLYLLYKTRRRQLSKDLKALAKAKHQSPYNAQLRASSINAYGLIRRALVFKLVAVVYNYAPNTLLSYLSTYESKYAELKRRD